MKKLWAISLLFLTFFCPFSFNQKIYSALDSLKTIALDETLKCFKLKNSNLTFRNDYLEVDAFRSKIIDQLIKDPLEISKERI